MRTESRAKRRTRESSNEIGGILTAANILTFARILLIAPFIYLVLSARFGPAFGVFAAASVTDFFDGYLARKLNQCSAVGRFLDPAADKLLTTASYIVLAIPREGLPSLPIWLAVIVISRDLLILIGSSIIYLMTRYSGFRPTLVGKVTLFAESAVVAAFLALHGADAMLAALPVLYVIVAALAVASGVQYSIAGVVVLRSGGPSSSRAGR